MSSEADALVEHLGLVLTPWQKDMVDKVLEEEREIRSRWSGVSPHSRGQAFDVHHGTERSRWKMERFLQMYGRASVGRTQPLTWEDRTHRIIRGVIIDGVEVKVYLPLNGRWSLARHAHYWSADVAFELYDHVVKYMDPTGNPWSNRTKPRCECTCGWKSSGDDCGTRAETHIQKLRDWLDQHPEEEVMAGLGGQISWPKRQPQSRKKKAFKNKRRRR